MKLRMGRWVRVPGVAWAKAIDAHPATKHRDRQTDRTAQVPTHDVSYHFWIQGLALTIQHRTHLAVPAGRKQPHRQKMGASDKPLHRGPESRHGKGKLTVGPKSRQRPHGPAQENRLVSTPSMRGIA